MGIEVTQGVTKGNFLFLFLISFVNQWVMTIIGVIRAAFLKEIIGVPDSIAGTVNVTLYNITAPIRIFFTVYVGALSDRVGRRPLMLIGFATTAMMFIVYAHCKDIANFVGLESLMSVLVLLSVISLVSAILFLFTWPQIITMGADYSLPQSRGRIMAIQGMSMGISSIIVYAVFGQLPKHIGIIPMFYLGTAFALICLLLIRIGLVEKMPAKRDKKEIKTFQDIKELLKLTRKSRELQVGYISMLTGRADVLVISQFIMIWMVTTCQDFGFTAAQATTKGAIALAFFSVFMQPQMPLLGILTDKWGRIPTLIVTLLIGGIGFCVLGMVENPFSKIVWLIVIFCSTAFGGGLASQALVADSAPKHLVGTAMSGLNTAMMVGGLVFSQVGGFLFDAVGYGTPFIFKGVANILVALWIFSVRKGVKDTAAKGGRPGHR